MKAAAISGYGGPDRLIVGEQPMPEIGPHDLLVRVKAASLNPVDYKIRNGQLRIMISYRMPLILGQECSGVVEKIGSAVTEFKVGDEVYARLDKNRIGTLAEFAAVGEADAALKPRNLSHVEAASIPLVGLTAWQIMHDVAKVRAGQTVLIHAGSGGVGTFAIQLARHLGARVATTVSARNAELVKRLGADIVIDYKTQLFEDVIRDVDLAFDTQGGETLLRSIDITKPGGHTITIGGMPTPRVMREWKLPSWKQWLAGALNMKTNARARKRGVHFDYHFMHPSGAALRELTKLLESKTIVPVIDKTYPLDQAREAIAYLESGRAVGKVVVTI